MKISFSFLPHRDKTREMKGEEEEEEKQRLQTSLSSSGDSCTRAMKKKAVDSHAKKDSKSVKRDYLTHCGVE